MTFVVTGAQRSATGYTAALLTALGCPCGHEAVFNADRLRRRWLAGRLLGVLLRLDAGREFLTPDEVTVTAPGAPAPPRGDASWLAAAYLNRMPAGTVVLHQVREPLAVMRSMVRSRFFQESTHRTFAEQHCSAVRQGSVLERLMTYWVEWNEMAAAAARLPHLRYVRLRIEDFRPALLEQIGALVGFPYDADRATAILASLPRDINTRGVKRRDWAIRWETLPSGRPRSRLEGLARAYGYTLP